MTHVTLHAHEARKLATDGSLLWVRPVKEQPPDDANVVDRQEDGSWQFGIIGGLDDPASAWGEPIGEPIRCPLTPGTEVWGRETWDYWGSLHTANWVIYRADGDKAGATWRSPVTMAKELSRFPRLLVGEVRCVRVGELGETDATAAGYEELRSTSYHGGVYYTAVNSLQDDWQRRYAKIAPWPDAYAWAVELTVLPDSPAKKD